MANDPTVHWANIWIPLLLLLPNLAYLLWKPAGKPEAGRPGALTLILTAVERLGQLGSFLSPLFFPLVLRGNRGILLSLVMAMSMVVYYIGWTRYFGNGREYRLLFERVFSMPLPMALCPMIFLCCVALAERSLVVGACVVLLAAGHLPLSIMEKRRCDQAAG
jgi:ABC-type transport system involved in cytochrome c biogenesis permease subunit